jgi:hypothetical protein
MKTLLNKYTKFAGVYGSPDLGFDGARGEFLDMTFDHVAGTDLNVLTPAG